MNGCVVSRTWSSMYSLGRRRTHGTSSRSDSQSLSRRHMTSGSQAKPPSAITTRRPGKRSNTPWQTRLMTLAWKIWLSAVCHST